MGQKTILVHRLFIISCDSNFWNFKFWWMLLVFHPLYSFSTQFYSIFNYNLKLCFVTVLFWLWLYLVFIFSNVWFHELSLIVCILFELVQNAIKQNIMTKLCLFPCCKWNCFNLYFTGNIIKISEKAYLIFWYKD